MKASEAPEKLYFGESDKGILDIYSTKESDNDIEYTRTDAFIEKAREYLQINLWRVVNEESDFRQRFVTDFRNYMKGE